MTIPLVALTKFETLLAKFQTEITTNLKATRTRMDIAFEAIQGEADKSLETAKGRAVNAAGDLTKLANTEIPLTQSMVETTTAYLAGTFLNGYPIFHVTSTRENESATAQLNVLTARDQIRFSWPSELYACLEDSVQYPFCAAEISWYAKRGNTAKVKTVDNVTTAVASPELFSGNKIAWLDPYNTFYDITCEPTKVHEFGGYVGYVESLTYIQMKRKLMDLDEIYTYKDNVKNIFKTGAHFNTLFKPLKSRAGAPKVNQGTGGVDWSISFNTVTPESSDQVPSSYELVTSYWRLCPADFGLTTKYISNPEAPTVFQLVWCNGKLIMAKPIVAGHEYLPIILGQFRPGQYSRKTLVENQIPFQYATTALLSASFASMRKAVGGGDRLYNTKYVNPGVFQQVSDKGLNIPVTIPAMKEGVNLNSVYAQIPYEDRVSPQAIQLLNLCVGLGEKISGINATTQGNFQKGNRTLHEFDSIQSNSQSRLALGALLLEYRFFAPIKEIVKLNYLVYAEVEEAATAPNLESSVAIEPDELRKSAPEYVFGDGFLPSNKVKNTDAALMALQLLAQSPEKAAEYDIGAIAVSIIQDSGFTHLNSYKRSPEQMQQYQASLAQAQGQQVPPGQGV